MFHTLFAAACFGATAIFTRAAYADGANVYGVLMPRFILAALVLAALLQHRRIGWPRGRQLLSLSLLGGVGYVAQAFCFFTALQYAQASLVALLLYLYPMFVLVLAALFLKEKVTLPQLLALLFCLAGTAMTIGGGQGQPLGIALGIASAVVYAGYIIASDRLIRGVNPLAATTVVCTAAAVVYTAVAAIRTAAGLPVQFPASGNGWLAIAGVALVSTVLSILCFFAGLKQLGPTRAAMVSTVEPVVTTALAWMLLGEALTALQMAGGAVVLAAALWLAQSGGAGDARAAASGGSA